MLVVPMTPTAPHVHSPKLNPSPVTIVSPARDAVLPVIATSTVLTGKMSETTATSKRPKLSLQTSSLPLTFGKSTTGLVISHSLSANALASPTVRNTYSNAYELPHRPSPASASPANLHNKNAYHPPRRIVSPYPKKDDEPYTLPIGLKSILRNTPHRRSSHARSGSTSMRRSSIPCLASTNSASPRERKRVFFPSTKKVSYRLPLTEEITTVKYTWRHSDLPSNADEIEETPIEPESHDSQSSSSDSDSSARSLTSPPKRKRQDSTRESAAEVSIRSPRFPKQSAENVSTETLSASTSRTPHSRKRRRREWKWTLGPITLPAPFPDPISNRGHESFNTANPPPADSSASSSALSTPPSSLASSFSSLSGKPKLGINTSMIQSASTNSSYTASPELFAEAGTDGVTKKLMPEQKTPFPFSRESSVESEGNLEASNPEVGVRRGTAGSVAVTEQKEGQKSI